MAFALINPSKLELDVIIFFILINYSTEEDSDKQLVYFMHAFDIKIFFLITTILFNLMQSSTLLVLYIHYPSYGYPKDERVSH